MVCLKKIACLLACCFMAACCALTVSAKESAVRVFEDQIQLTDTQTAFEAVVEVEPEQAYAGVEIGISCPENVVVVASSSSSGSMSAAPVLANGLYWTSFFESDNKLWGPMKITLQLSCPQTLEEGDINIEEVKVLTKEGASVVTEKLKPSLKIHIARGDSSTATEPTPTDQSSDIDTVTDGAKNDTDQSAPGAGGKKSSSTGEKENPLGFVLLFVSGTVGTAVFLSRKSVKRS